MGIQKGTVLLDRYRAVQLLGRGGMGEVWACLDTEEQRTVAVKLLLPHLVTEAWVHRLFQAEVVAVARLSHPGIVEVYDLLQLPDGASLLVMGFRPGKPLDSAFDKLTWPNVREVLTQLLRALAHAHARSVLHLDLKPENVLVRVTPAIKTTLVDFGIARLLRPGAGAESWFEDGSIVGTPDYMAPEQWRGHIEKLGPWTDLYSVGLLAHELCTGHLPFEREIEDVDKARRRRMKEPAPRMRPDLAGVPDEFIELCGHLLELAPTARPVCAADVLAALDGLGGSSDTPAPADTTPRAAESRRAATLAAPASEPDSKRLMLTELDALPASRDSRPSSRNSVTTRRTTGRWHGDDAEEAFEAEAIAPSPGAYGLFGLREVPVLGRVEERRALWNAVRLAVETDTPSAVLLRGPPGTGKSRISRDAIERALELGLAVELSTHWSATGSPDEGLHGLVENALGTRGSQGEAFEARLAFFMARFPLESEAIKHEAKVLLRPEPDAAPDAALPVRVATDAVIRAASHRPVLLRLDDVHWSHGEAAALIQAIAEAKPEFGVCIIATEREEESSTDYVDALETYAGAVVRISMQPLGVDATRALVRGLLDLDDELAQIVARRAEGNPLFASQLVGQLVKERAIERRGQKYVLATSVDLDRVVPPDMGAVWARSVYVSGADEDDLASFALVRERVSSEVVEALARNVGERFNTSFARALSSGLIRKDGDLYAFSHGLLRDYLVHRLDGERRARVNATAANALLVLVGREDVEEARGQLLWAAERREEARDAMLSAAMWSWRRAERGPRERRLKTLIDWSTSTDAIVMRARALADLSQFHAESGAFEQANPTIAAARIALARATEAPGYAKAAAWVGFREAQVTRLQGRVCEGATASEGAIPHARESGELEVQALCLAQLGLDGFRRGDNDEARARYDEALGLVRKAGNRATEAQILMMRSATEEPRQMEILSRAAVDMAREAGALRIELMARQAWTEALFRTGERGRARMETRALSVAAQRRGLRQTVSMVEGVAACWAVLDGAWTEAEAHRSVAEKWGASTGAAPERATAAAIDVALALTKNDEVAVRRSLEVLLREGRTYREPHFQEVISRLMKTAPSPIKDLLQGLDAADSEA